MNTKNSSTYQYGEGNMFKKILFINLIICLTFQLSNSFAQNTGGDITARVKQALGASFRTDDDRNADAYRKPAETLAFFGLRDDMRVLELMPAGGYYTKILGQVLADKGTLYEALKGNSVAENLPAWGLTKIQILDDKFEMTRGEKRGYNIISDTLEFPVSDLDMVLTFRNLHDFSPESRKILNTQVFKALKSGGIYGVVDHTRRHMEPYNEERWRRLDPVGVIKEIQDLGFRFVDYSDLHYREHDPLKTDTTVPEINRDSDRFTLIFVKP
jgi:predicted methyltransferase